MKQITCISQYVKTIKLVTIIIIASSIFSFDALLPFAYADYAFDPIINLSNTDPDSSNDPRIAAVNNKVYVVWQDNDANLDILFSRSTDSGGNFGAPVNLSGNAGNSFNQRIVVTDSSVFVVWQDSTSGNNEILFRRSTDSGANFDSTVNLSSDSSSSVTPQIVVSGSSVFVVWQDSNNEILFRRSTDSGTSFESVVNLSNNAGTSSVPQIVVSGSTVFVVWQDSTSGNIEILFRRSTDSGTSFESVVNLSNNSGSSTSPQITLSGNNVFVVWRDSTPGNNDVFIKTSSNNGATFSGSNNLSNNGGDSVSPQISATDTKVHVAWSDDDSGNYEILYRSGISSSINIVFDASQYKLSSTATISITSTSSNANSGLAETITPVTITSTSDSTGITRTFLETGINTGIFSGQITFTTGSSSGSTLQSSPGDTITATFSSQSGTSNIFTRTVNFDLDAYLPSSIVVITIIDQNSNANSGSVETISVLVTSTSELSSTFNFQESGSDTGIFAIPSNLQFQAGNGDTITASYLSATDTAIVTSGGGPGGGGGGLVRPGLVLDVLLGSSSSDNSPPSFVYDGLNSVSDPLDPLEPSTDTTTDFPLTIDGKGYDVASYASTIVTNIEEVEKPIDLKLVFSDPSGIQHVALYTNMREHQREISNSDTYIIYNKNTPLEVVDPNDLFSDIAFTITNTGNKYEIHYKITFAKPMEKSDIVLRVWDQNLNSADIKILDAWQIIESQIKEPPSIENTPTVDSTQTAKVLGEENMPDLIPVIEKWGGFSSESISDAEMLKEIGIDAQYIPSWFVKIAKWTVSGDLKQDEFVNAIKYLHENGIIK